MSDGVIPFPQPDPAPTAPDAELEARTNAAQAAMREACRLMSREEMAAQIDGFVAMVERLDDYATKMDRRLAETLGYLMAVESIGRNWYGTAGHLHTMIKTAVRMAAMRQFKAAVQPLRDIGPFPEGAFPAAPTELFEAIPRPTLERKFR